jgi:hypothetical protein
LVAHRGGASEIFIEVAFFGSIPMTEVENV